MIYSSCSGVVSAAMKRYSRRIIAVSLYYAATLIVTTILIRRDHVNGWPVYPLAVLPALGVVGMIWVIGKLIAELKDDGYQQILVVKAVLYSTGFIVSASTIWDFLAAYAGVPAMPPFVIMTAWLASFGVGNAIMRVIYK